MAARSAGRARRLRGVAIVAASAVCFGRTPIFARAAYRSGADPVFALAVRFAAASAVLLLLLWAVPGAGVRRLPRGRTLRALVLLGGVCYAGEALCYFWALQRAPATLVAVLLYLYPALVVALSRVLHGVRVSPAAGSCLAVAVVGSALAVGPVAAGARTGALLAVAAAAAYAVYIVLAAEPVRAAGPLVATAVVCTVAAAGLFLAGLSLLGPTDASTVATLEPVVSAVLAATLLGDRFTSVQLLGAGLVIVAVVALARTAGNRTELAGAAPQPAQAP